MRLLPSIARLPGPALVLCTVLAACAAPTPGAADAQDRQVRPLIVRTIADWPSATEFARRAADVARVPVHEASAIAPRQFRLSLLCGDAITCEAAVRRLSAEPAFVFDVLPDQRRRLPARPTPPTTQ